MWKPAVVLFVCLTAAGAVDQGRGARTATLAIHVSDPAGTPISGVVVTLTGPAEHRRRTEGGRLAIENLPPGSYRLRFEHPKFVTHEHELTAKAGAPMDVKVTLDPVSAAPDPPEEAPPAPARAGTPVALDLLAIVEAEFVGRAPQRMTQLACEGEVRSTLIQLNQPLEMHVHDAADETLYVVAGRGTARSGGVDHPLEPGTFLLVPRGAPHAVAVTGRNPLVLLSNLTGEPCRPAGK
jgi:mannose-6-phosphate isomerase-like protein (cupin superfamily)